MVIFILTKKYLLLGDALGKELVGAKLNSAIINNNRGGDNPQKQSPFEDTVPSVEESLSLMTT